MPFSAGAAIRAIRSVVQRPAEHHAPMLGDAEAAALARCASDLTSYKPVSDLERALEVRCKVSHAVATSSGSAALDIAMTCVGVMPGDAVLMPSMAFVAAAAAVVHAGAHPIFLDSLFQDFGINPYKMQKFLERETTGVGPNLIHVKTRRRIAAVILVHVFGHPCAIRRLSAIAAQRQLPVIEDAAEALGSLYNDVPCGSWGSVSVLSFNYNKIVTGGGGGAVLTNDPALGRHAHSLATTGRVPHPWLVRHSEVAWNHRMPTLCAAVAGAQMRRLDRFLSAKRALAVAYQTALQNVPGVSFHAEPVETSSNHWLCTLMVDPRWPGGRDEILAGLHEHAVKARAAFTPLHMLTPYATYEVDNALIAEDIWRRAVCLPSGAALGERFL